MGYAFTSCETWRSDCEGKIEVVNPIPDTTLYVGEEPFERDLFETPVVLRHTGDRQIFINVLSSNGTVVKGTSARSSTTGRLNAIEITPLKAGDSKITIVAEDGCEYYIKTSFNVSVVDTTI